jgi:hypothetical protein
MIGTGYRFTTFESLTSGVGAPIDTMEADQRIAENV